MSSIESTKPMEHTGIEQVLQHVQNNTVPVREGSKCVDGRYVSEEGKLARPGADFGYVMPLLALNRKLNLGLTPQECVDKVYAVVTQNGQQFSMHTDHHAHPEELDHAHHDKPIIGCGHIAKATLPKLAEGYGLAANDVETALDYIQTKPVHMVNLPGKHEELGVLVVKGEKNSVKPYDPNRKAMYFVYDASRDQEKLAKIAETLGIPEVDYDSYKQAADVQLQATLTNLAVGKPIYEVNVDQEKPQVNFVGNVEPR